jgi:CRISPR-associated endonuclease/helicase Cas3
VAMDLTGSSAIAYQTLTDHAEANPMQEAVWRYFAGTEGVGLLLKGPTGSGKTEAIVIPALAHGRRLIMVYPTRSLVDDQIARLSIILSKFSYVNGGKPVTLNIDTGATSERQTWVNGESIAIIGNTRRHLYQGDIIITTLDKFLYRFFGFGEPDKSFIFPLRINYGLRQSLICFDESHSYDEVAFTNFTQLVRTLFERGLDVVLMTATMPAKKQQYINFLDAIDFVDDLQHQASLTCFTRARFPQRCHPDRQLSWRSAPVSESEEGESVLPAALAQAVHDHFQADKRMIVIAERVKDAVETWRILCAEFGRQTPIWLYHGRLTQAQRKKVYDALAEADKTNKGYLLVSTSAIEVGCDLNAHILITQLCDPDRLIQRVGRCNRRQEMTDAQVVVVGDDIPQWLTVLSPDDLKQYKIELQRQAGSNFQPAPLLECLQSEPRMDHRIEMMFDMLYEYVYEAKLENKPLHDKGLIITRSWEPSLTICTHLDEKGQPANAVSVPMRSCLASQGESLDLEWTLYKWAFDQQEKKPIASDLRGWECAYFVDAIAYREPCELYLDDFDAEIGWVELPKLFNYSFSQGYRRVLVREVGNNRHLLWYISGLRDLEISQSASGKDEPESVMEDEADEE